MYGTHIVRVPLSILFLLQNIHHDCEKLPPSTTLRQHHPVYFQLGTCQSIKNFRPKYCRNCQDGLCCKPLYTATSHIDFICQNTSNNFDSEHFEPDIDIVYENLQLGSDLWTSEDLTQHLLVLNDVKTNYNSTRLISVNVQWVLKCVCDICDNFRDRDSNRNNPDVVTRSTKSELLHRVHRTAPP